MLSDNLYKSVHVYFFPGK